MSLKCHPEIFGSFSLARGVSPQHRTAHAQRVYVPSPQWRPNLVTPQPAQRAPDVPSRSHTVSKDCFKPGGQSAPAAATAMERPGLDPLQICVTEVVPQDADRPITAEQFFHRLIMRQRGSPLSNFWVLPLTIEEMVSQSARRRWLASVTEAEFSKESVQAIAANLLAGVGHMNQQLHMSSARLQVLATAAAAAGVDPDAVSGKPLRAGNRQSCVCHGGIQHSFPSFYNPPRPHGNFKVRHFAAFFPRGHGHGSSKDAASGFLWERSAGQ